MNEGTPIKKRIERGVYWSRAWSLVEGCTPVSESCEHCWLAGIAHRFCRHRFYRESYPRLTDRNGRFTGRVIPVKYRLELPRTVKKPTTWAIWSDLFHKSMPADFITHAFEVMDACPQHTFLVLTKRPERLEPVLYGPEGGYFLGGGDYIKNVWLGTTVENQGWADIRIPHLLKCWPFNLFLSVEPILSNVKEELRIVPGNTCPLRWVVVGCESGPKRRPAELSWFRDIRDQCRAAGVLLFVKQIEINGRVSHDMSKWPEDLRIRELPWSR